MINKINIKEKIILYSFFIYLFVVLLIQNSTLNLNPTYSNFSNTIGNIFMISCLVFAIFFNEYTVKNILRVICLIFLLLVTRLIVGVSPLLDLLIVTLGLQSIQLEKILKTFFSAQVISAVLTLILFFLNIIPDRLLIRDGVERSSLGFWHPNTTGLVLLSIFILTLFISKRKNILLVLIIFNFLSYLVFMSTNSRTSFILIGCSTLIAIFDLIIQGKARLILKSKWIIPTLIVMFFLGSYIASSIYSSAPSNLFLNELNTMLSNRISIGSRFIDEYGISLFGNPIIYNSSNFNNQVVIGASYWVLDNIYLKYILNYGLVSSILLISYFYVVISKLNSKYIVAFNLYSLVYLIYGLSEQSAFSITINVFMLFGIIVLNPNNNKKFIQEDEVIQ